MSMRFIPGVLALLMLASCQPVSPPPTVVTAPMPVVVPSESIFFVSSSENSTGRFEIRNLPPAQLAALENHELRAKAFTVTVDGETPLLGRTGITDGVLWFQPRFPLQYDVPHTATFDPTGLPGGGTKLTTKYTISSPAAPPTTVTAVYPSGDVLPENVLRFYLHFSAPMKRGEVYRRTRILDETGTPIDLPFLELDEELWDPTGTRITVYIDPGRIKRGLKPREDVGPVFLAGKKYTLEIATEWPDSANRPLKEPFRKSFTIASPAETRIDPVSWTIRAPTGAAQSLTVRFPIPLDHGLLEHSLTVSNADGKRVDGTITITDAEKSWRFQPREPWTAGTYTLTVNPDLEDIAGNRPDRLFDTPESAADPNYKPQLQRTFTVP